MRRFWTLGAALVAVVLVVCTARADEQRDRIERLEAENAVLKREVRALAERIEALEKKLGERREAVGPTPAQRDDMAECRKEVYGLIDTPDNEHVEANNKIVDRL